MVIALAGKKRERLAGANTVHCFALTTPEASSDRAVEPYRAVGERDQQHS